MTNTTDERKLAAFTDWALTQPRPGLPGSGRGFYAGWDYCSRHEGLNRPIPVTDDTAHMAKVLESREPYAPPSDDAWRATLQATINQQAEEIERLREAERRLITMVKVGTGAA